MQEAAVANMNPFGRVAVCGVIAEYTTDRRAAPDMLDVVYKRITIQGFLASDFIQDHFTEFISTTSNYLRDGRMLALEDISKGLETIPMAFSELFDGGNIGKKLVQVADLY